MIDEERGPPIENYGKKEQKEWLDNTLPESYTCTAGNKEKEHKTTKRIIILRIVYINTENSLHKC